MTDIRPDQIDLRAKVYGPRVVAYAAARRVHYWLSQGFSRGRFCKIKRGYAIIRPPKKVGKPPKLTDEQLAYVDAAKREYWALRRRINQLPEELGVCEATLNNSLARYRKRRRGKS